MSYQVGITYFNFAEYVFFAPRVDFVSANREGIISVIGYFSLQLVGVGLGRFLYYEMLDPVHLDMLKYGRPMAEIEKFP